MMVYIQIKIFFQIWEYYLEIEDGYAFSKIKITVILLEVHFKERASENWCYGFVPLSLFTGAMSYEMTTSS
jgi:hypothetical protein